MDLEPIRQWMPQFQCKDFDLFDTITRLVWEVTEDSLGETQHILTLTMTSPRSYQIQLEFLGVTSFRFDGSESISGFYIRDMAPLGYESCVRYEVGDSDYEEDVLQFYCRDVRILGMERLFL
ncbi:MAG TPA: hypothetical protein H9841_06955 [Candidatus Flavonifractor merdigallinarum]|uniref:Uncharacterized protein n=1 Tax=Candidatus Flavonifractor merdigallinarum TaxID=2838589 RepID=A0A9D2BZM6_9FIRM|nr:hypothetical protein [Candidatus Flavonifractor merdigallinarum]